MNPGPDPIPLHAGNSSMRAIAPDDGCLDISSQQAVPSIHTAYHVPFARANKYWPYDTLRLFFLNVGLIYITWEGQVINKIWKSEKLWKTP